MYWLRCHTFTRYHIIDIRGQCDYKWGWIDRDWAIFLACFKCLVDYVEKEKPFDVIDWESDEGHSDTAKEIKDLYDWWKVGRAKEHTEVESLLTGLDLGFRFIDIPDSDMKQLEPRQDLTNNDKWNLWRKRTDELEAKDDEMLMRLIKIRRYLWT